MSLVPITYHKSRKCTPVIEQPPFQPISSRLLQQFQHKVSDKMVEERKRFQSLPHSLKEMITNMSLKDKNSLSRDEIIKAAFKPPPEAHTHTQQPP